MTIEVSLLLSGVSIAFAIFFGISTRNRNERDQGVLHQGIRKPEAASQACG